MSGYFEGTHRTHAAVDVIRRKVGDEFATVTVDGKTIELAQNEMTYAAWFQLEHAAPGETVNILRRIS